MKKILCLLLFGICLSATGQTLKELEKCEKNISKGKYGSYAIEMVGCWFYYGSGEVSQNYEKALYYFSLLPGAMPKFDDTPSDVTVNSIPIAACYMHGTQDEKEKANYIINKLTLEQKVDEKFKRFFPDQYKQLVVTTVKALKRTYLEEMSKPDGMSNKRSDELLEAYIPYYEDYVDADLAYLLRYKYRPFGNGLVREEPVRPFVTNLLTILPNHPFLKGLTEGGKNGFYSEWEELSKYSILYLKNEGRRDSRPLELFENHIDDIIANNDTLSTLEYVVENCFSNIKEADDLKKLYSYLQKVGIPNIQYSKRVEHDVWMVIKNGQLSAHSYWNSKIVGARRIPPFDPAKVIFYYNPNGNSFCGHFKKKEEGKASIECEFENDSIIGVAGVMPVWGCFIEKDGTLKYDYFGKATIEEGWKYIDEYLAQKSEREKAEAAKHRKDMLAKYGNRFVGTWTCKSETSDNADVNFSITFNSNGTFRGYIKYNKKWVVRNRFSGIILSNNVMDAMLTFKGVWRIGFSNDDSPLPKIEDFDFIEPWHSKYTSNGRLVSGKQKEPSYTAADIFKNILEIGDSDKNHLYGSKNWCLTKVK